MLSRRQTGQISRNLDGLVHIGLCNGQLSKNIRSSVTNKDTSGLARCSAHGQIRLVFVERKWAVLFGAHGVRL